MTVEDYPPEHLIKMIGGHKKEAYKWIADHFFELFLKYGGLEPTDRVQDVGCGCGRMAFPLTRYLTTGSYEGFDIVGEMIDWCRENISSRFPNFQFQHVDVFNGEYNKSGTVNAVDFRFPYSDASFDFTFLTSIFTHLLEADVAHYCREIARTLKPSGTAVLTFYILNDEAERLMTTPECKVLFPYAWGNGGIKVSDQTRPEALVAYPEATLRQLLPANGLQIEGPIHFGSWCGRPELVTYQDLIVVKRK